MRKTLPFLAAITLLTACQKQMELATDAKPVQEVEVLKKHNPFVITKELDKSSPLLSMKVNQGSFPPVVTTTAVIELDRAAIKPKDYEAISGAELILQVQASKAEEFSMPGEGTIRLALEKFDRENGILYFALPKTSFSLRWPELSFTVDATINLTYTYREEKPAGRSGSVVPARREVASQIIKDWPLTLKRNGKPFLVEIIRVKDGAAFPFVMYASSEKEVDVLCGQTSHFRKGEAKARITLLKDVPAGLEELNPYFNVDNLTLVGIESPTVTIGTVPSSDQPWVVDPAWAADGKGTKRTTSQARTKPDLL